MSCQDNVEDLFDICYLKHLNYLMYQNFVIQNIYSRFYLVRGYIQTLIYHLFYILLFSIY